MSRYSHDVLSATLFGATLLLTVAGGAIAALPDKEHAVSQKGRQFHPDSIVLHAGEHITVINDDGDLIHHAYIDAPDLTYDSGDQEPGMKAVITFPKDGDFLVLCGIHPKMKLAVHVQ